MARTLPALSLKQPWAALLVHARKTIEIRSWPTSVRGWVLIHASRQEDERPHAWRHVDDDVSATSQLRGGIIGAARLVECRTYQDMKRFRSDRPRHLNLPAWFRPAGTYGFVFVEAQVLPYHRVPGWVKFFDVDARRYALS